MNQFIEFLHRLGSDKGRAYSFIRIFLGLALFIRGVLLMSDPNAIIQLVAVEKLHMWYSYITIGHILGGLLIAVGFYTRFGALLQIPILVGAVLVAEPGKGLMMGGQSLELASLVLFLLFIHFLFGSGTLSVDDYLEKRRSK